MHSRIFQISEEVVEEFQRIDESPFYECFVGAVADYVDEGTNREEDIKWLMETIEKFGAVYDPTDSSIVFTKGFKQKYFAKKFESFKDLVQNINLERFAGDHPDDDGMEVYHIAQLVEEKYSFYVYNDNKCWETFDRFVRDMEEDKKYYFGSTIDYHV